MIHKNLNDIEFTFYGDLLGVSNLYSIDQELAKDKLNDFYNLVYDKFQNMANNKGIDVFLFSDSLFISGNKLEKTIQILGEIYYDLFYKNIFLRGAIVGGKLDFDPRIELENLKKRLPSTDVLFRVVSLEKSVKGIRLLIEKKLAKDILPSKWLTEELYKANVSLAGYDKYDFRRRIVLSCEWNAYEYLWPCRLNPSELFRSGIANYITRLMTSPHKLIEERLLQVPRVTRIHLEETKELLKRSAYRYEITNQALNLSQR